MLLAIDQSDAELLLRARQISVLGKIKTKVLCGGRGGESGSDVDIDHRA